MLYEVITDAGVSCKRLLEGLEICGLSAQAVKAVFITHEHSDHVSGLSVFTNKYKVPVFAQEKTLEHLIAYKRISPATQLCVVSENGVDTAGFFIKSFKTPHDSRNNFV